MGAPLRTLLRGVEKKGEPPISSGVDSASAQASAAESRRRDNRLTRHLARPETGAIAATVAVFVFFSLASPHFLGERVLGTILLSAATLGILAVGVCMLMIAGQFDLSVGSVYGVASGIALTLLNMGVPAPAALVITLAAGLAIGALNGFLVTRLGIHSFIITLGCQWRSKKGPPRRCKKGPLGGCGLVPVVHGRAPRATRRALNRLTRRRAREGPVGPRGQAWAGWSVQLAVGV